MNCVNCYIVMRRAGVGAIKNRSAVQAKFKDKGSELASEQLVEMTAQMAQFRTSLEDFAGKHKQDISKDASFRTHFTHMCAAIGVDPLASSKGFWCSVLGVGDFYYELAVQVVEVCVAATARTGGLMQLDELNRRVNKSRGSNKLPVSNEDMLTSLKSLKVLGGGLKVIKMDAGKHLIQSVPGELSTDHTTVLHFVQEDAHTSETKLSSSLHWSHERIKLLMEWMVSEGMAWVDQQDEVDTLYWFPAFFNA